MLKQYYKVGVKVEIQSGNLAEKVHDLNGTACELVQQLYKKVLLCGKPEACW